MAIDSKNRNKLIKLFKDVDYRKIVSQRAGCHPNTVTNVLNGNDNPTVELEILILAQQMMEQKQKEEEIRRKSSAIIKQL